MEDGDRAPAAAIPPPAADIFGMPGGVVPRQEASIPAARRPTRTRVRQSADQRLAPIWFGEANRTEARALTVATGILPPFRN